MAELIQAEFEKRDDDISDAALAVLQRELGPKLRAALALVEKWRHGRVMTPTGEMQLHGGLWIADLCSIELAAAIQQSEQPNPLEQPARKD